MANKSISKPSDKLILVNFKILESQKNFLNNLEEPASAVIRKLIASQMHGHEVDITKLREEKEHKEAELNIINAQIAELEASLDRKQNSIIQREKLLKQNVESLVKNLSLVAGYLPEIESYIKARVKDMNATIGSDSEQFTVEELTQAVITEAESLGNPVIRMGRPR